MIFLDFFLRFLNPTPTRLRRRARLMRAYAARLDRRAVKANKDKANRLRDHASNLRDWANDLLEEANRT